MNSNTTIPKLKRTEIPGYFNIRDKAEYESSEACPMYFDPFVNPFYQLVSEEGGDTIHYFDYFAGKLASMCLVNRLEVSVRAAGQPIRPSCGSAGRDSGHNEG
jgi:hypothetical protein